jgi:hypothetical protein
MKKAIYKLFFFLETLVSKYQYFIIPIVSEAN